MVDRELSANRRGRTNTMNNKPVLHYLISVAPLALSLASVLVAFASLWVARSSLRQAERVAERDGLDWRQRKWFDLYFKVNEAYDLLDHFQAQWGSPAPESWTRDHLAEWNNLMRRIREAHTMATVFPKNLAVDELFECTKFKNPADSQSKERLRRLLEAAENLRQNALIDDSVLGVASS
jgi:hypothetical protein